MATNIWLGTSLPNNKTVQVTPGPNLTTLQPPPSFKLGLGNALFTFTEWDAANIVSTWNTSTNPLISEVTAAVSGSTLIFTANNAGEDFEIICTLVGGVINSSSTYQLLALDPVPTGGTFTITIGSDTTGNITYSATPATFASNIASAIDAMSGYGSTDVVVTSQTSTIYMLDFSNGRFAGTNVAAVTATHTSLTGGNATVPVQVIAAGATSSSGTNEVITVSFPANGTHTENIDSIQTLDSAAVNGSFTITISGYGTTGILPYTAGRTTIQSALEGICGIGNVSVTGGPLYYPADGSFHQIIVEFIGALAGIAISTMTITVVTGGANEIQQIIMTGVPTSGTFTLTYSGQTTSGIAYGASAATVQTALIALSNLAPGDVVCSGGPLIPGGSPTTATVANTGNMLAVYDPTNPSASYGTNLAPIQLLTGAFPTVVETSFIKFPVTGYTTGFTLKLTNNNAGVDTIFSIIDADNADFPVTYTAFNGNTYYGSIDMSGATHTTPTDEFSKVLSVYVIDITALITHVRSRAGWRDGNNVVIKLSNPTTNTGNFVPNHGKSQYGDILVSSWWPNASQTILAGSYGPIALNFGGTLVGTDLSQTTATNSGLTGGAVATSTLVNGNVATYTPASSQTGGSATVQNIKGGTFSLKINSTIVSGIPYNTSAANLVSMINTKFGSTVCTATGGAAPGTSIVVTFAGTLGLQPLTINFYNATATNLDGSVTQSIIRHGVAPATATNVWDIAVCPGDGTPGVKDSAQVLLTLTNNLASSISGTYIAPIGQALLSLSKLSPEILQESINEILSQDACRVCRIGSSQELANVVVPATPGNVTEYMSFWYIKDTYRVVFFGDYAAADSVSLSVSLSPSSTVADLFDYVNATPPAASTQDPDTGDTLDSFPEESRIIMGFKLLEGTVLSPIICQASQSIAVPANNLSWRFKLRNRTVESSGNHYGIADVLVGRIAFTWNRVAIDDTGLKSYTIVQSSLAIDWNSPTSVIKTTIEDMFFGAGNVVVTGGLFGSWVSESLLDAPVTVSYQDLNVALTGVLQSMPIDDYGYELRCSLIDSTYPGSSSFQQTFKMYSGEVSRTFPPHTNRRERVSIGNLGNVQSINIGVADLLVNVPTDATAAQIQTAIDGLFPEYTTAVANNLPGKLIHPVFVYGTTFADGAMEFEFTGACLQQNDTYPIIISPVTSAVVGQAVITTLGVLPTAAIDAHQIVTIAGSPYGGTFTLTFGGHTTGSLAYNISLAALITAVTSANFSSPTITGSAADGFTFIWAGSGGARAAITSTPSLNNANVTVTVSNLGGLSSTFTVQETTKGRGPNYLDDSNNWSLGRVLNSSDTAVFDDSPIPVLYGLDMSSVVQVQSIGSNPQFIHNRKRKVFDNDQTVVFFGTGTEPAGLTFGTVYKVASAASSGIFSITALDGSTVTTTTIGSGVFNFVVSDLDVQVYSRFGGAQIGLPHLRSNTVEYLAQYWKAFFATIDIGIETGDGLSLGRFNSMTSSPEIDIQSTGSTGLFPIPAVLFLVDNVDATMTIHNGDVGIAVYAEESSVIGSITMEQGTLAVANASIDTLTKSASASVKLLNSTISHTVTLS